MTCPSTAHGLEQLIGDGRAHVDVVRLEEREMAEVRELFWILDKPGVHIDQGPALGNDLIGAIDQGVTGGRVNGNEIETLRGDGLQILQLLLVTLNSPSNEVTSTPAGRRTNLAVSMPCETQVDAAPTSDVAAVYFFDGRSSGSSPREASPSAAVLSRPTPAAMTRAPTMANPPRNVSRRLKPFFNRSPMSSARDQQVDHAVQILPSSPPVGLFVVLAGDHRRLSLHRPRGFRSGASRRYEAGKSEPEECPGLTSIEPPFARRPGI